MADKTMPPNDPMTLPETGAGMSPEAMPPEAEMPQQDAVMVTLPKADFDAANEMLNNLTAMFNQLAEGINAQQGAAEMGAMPGEMPPPTEVPTGEPGAEDMDAFLKSITEEGNMRSK
jgi:hypothetical protein